MSGIHNKVGGGGFGGGFGAQQAKGGSGLKPKGGSGQKIPPGQAKKDGSWMPPGLAKKYTDGFDGNQDGNSQGRGLLGGLFGQGGLLGGLNLGGLWGGWGGNNNGSYLNNFAGSTPQAVTQKNATPQAALLNPANQAQSVAAKDLDPISQTKPTGVEAINYTNGQMNCGPTVLAMIGDAYGKKPAGMTDAEYISKLQAQAGTTGQGTTGNGMLAALNDMGMETAANKGGDLNWINNQLAQGHNVIANGDYWSLPDHTAGDKVAGHYINVTAYSNGQYTIDDPATGTESTISAQQLADFIAHHPDGGFTLATWPEPTPAPAPVPAPALPVG